MKTSSVTEMPPVGAELPAGQCANCGAVVSSKFCAECGQKTGPVRVTWSTLMGDLVEGVFNLESRWLRTFGLLFTRPGFLTSAYWQGRRVHYMRPIQVYLVLSFLYFLALGLSGTALGNVHIGDGSAKGGVSNGVNIQFGTKAAKSGWQQKLQERAEHLSKSGDASMQRVIRGALTETVPKVMFGMLPIFALLLKLFYVRRPYFYTEHFIFALHTHAFGFAMLLVALLIPFSVAGGLVAVAIPAYFLISQKKVYGERWLRTVLKFFGVGFLYVICAALAFTVVVMWAVWWS